MVLAIATYTCQLLPASHWPAHPPAGLPSKCCRELGPGNRSYDNLICICSTQLQYLTIARMELPCAATRTVLPAFSSGTLYQVFEVTTKKSRSHVVNVVLGTFNGHLLSNTYWCQTLLELVLGDSHYLSFFTCLRLKCLGNDCSKHYKSRLHSS